MLEVTKQAIKNKLTFKEAWLVFGASIYTGFRKLKNMPEGIPPWSSEKELPDLTLPPDEL